MRLLMCLLVVMGRNVLPQIVLIIVCLRFQKVLSGSSTTNITNTMNLGWFTWIKLFAKTTLRIYLHLLSLEYKK
ncbi:hypothetical protein BA896_006535 [Janthinobacterium lividum]|uniref:Uncharacterized protein n=1 Tax=Janthinobacterium lividum TaxID=29581 RepID=A0A1E8PRI6_9BURK|nr:hypothetical protein BA896_006535 [Janthinobacterium lividum]